jgi:hypothetical protein
LPLSSTCFVPWSLASTPAIVLWPPPSLPLASVVLLDELELPQPARGRAARLSAATINTPRLIDDLLRA